MTEGFSEVYGNVTTGMELLIIYHFFTKFLQKKVKLIYDIVFAVLGTFLITKVPAGTMATTFLFLLLFIAGGIFICKANVVLAILYAILSIEIMQLSYGIFNSLLSILYPRIVSKNPIVIGNIFMIAGSMLSLAVAVLCYHILYQHFFYQETIQNQSYPLMLLIPTFMIVFVGEYINFNIYGNIITEESIKNINHYQMLIIQFLGILSLFCMMYAYKKLVESFQIKMKLSLLEQEIHSLNQYVDEAKTRYEKTKSFRHDIKNHITIITELLKNNQLEQALDYTEDMESMIEDLSFPCNTNHPVLDILLGNKLGIARSNGIDVSCSLFLPYPCFIHEIDFCIILSNALDNAISACKKIDRTKEKYIYVTGAIQGDFILLEIKNSFLGKEPIRWGTGLANIKAVAEKYHGAVNIKTQDAAFVLSVLLIIPQQGEYISQQTD